MSEQDRQFTDTERLDWLEKHADSLAQSGYGTDDAWACLIFDDGQMAECATLREAIDAAMRPCAKEGQ